MDIGQIITNKINNHDLTIVDTFVENINPKNVTDLTHAICIFDEHTKLLSMILDNDDISDYKKLMFFCFVNQKYFMQFVNKLKSIPNNFIEQTEILCCRRWGNDDLEILEQKCNYDDYIKFVKKVFETQMFIKSLEGLNFIMERYYNRIYRYEYFNRENAPNSFLSCLYSFFGGYYLTNDRQKDIIHDIPVGLINIIEHIDKVQILNDNDCDIIDYIEKVYRHKTGYTGYSQLDHYIRLKN